MKNILQNNYLLLFSRLILAIVFILASAGKISEPESFAVAISNYKIFPIFAINIFAIVLPWIEFVFGIFLLFGISVKECSVVFSLLLLVFILIILISIFRGLDINCGCFGTIEGQHIGVVKVLENFLLLSLAVHLMLFHNNEKTHLSFLK